VAEAMEDKWKASGNAWKHWKVAQERCRFFQTLETVWKVLVAFQHWNNHKTLETLRKTLEENPKH
jgi:hypothetical protein